MESIFYQAPGKYFAAHPLTEPVEWEYVPGCGYRYKGEEWPAKNGAQPSAATVDSWDPQPEAPPANPLTDVEIAARALATRRQTREDVIFSDTAGLVATCYAWLQRECVVPGGGTDKKTASQALQAGQELCSTSGYGVALRAWIDFAAPDFYQAMSAPDEARPWLEWVPAGEPKSIREAILDRVYLATYGVARK